MPELKTYRVFISHAWNYNDEYYRLRDLLNNAPNFRWQNYSVPSHDPLSGALRDQFMNRIRLTNIVLVLSGMYSIHSRWIQTEMRISRKMGKPIVGIVPQGAERVPRDIQDLADGIVRWNTRSIVNAIRRLSI